MRGGSDSEGTCVAGEHVVVAGRCVVLEKRNVE